MNEKLKQEHAQAVGQHHISNICVTWIPKEGRKSRTEEILKW